MEDYEEKFKELRALMLYHNPHLTESYFIFSFISGLQEDLKSEIKVLEPMTLNQAYEKAKLQEKSFDSILKKAK